ncbi:MAG: hypothetical protein ACKVS9_00635 [Phycisphaerae bacterium]
MERAEHNHGSVSHPGVPSVIDVRITKFNPGAFIVTFILISVLIFAMCVVSNIAFAIVAALHESGPLRIVAGCTFAVLLVAGLLLLYRGYRNRWLEIGVQDFRSGKFGGFFRQLVEEGRVDVQGGGGAWFVRQLARSGAIGCAVRLHMWDEFSPITPLMRQFEPRLILEGSDDFEQFLGDDADRENSAVRSVVPRDDAQRRESRPYLLAVGRDLRLVLAIAMFVVAAAVYAMGGASRGLAALLALVAILGVVEVGISHFLRTVGKQWLAVPGGIVIRRPSGLGGRSSLHLMRRSNSLILATRQLTDAFWRVTISDGKFSAARTMSNNELIVALRAWTRPLEPPAMDKLTDWVGEG